MNDSGSNFADETMEMVSENANNASAELRKRRSTRIVQAVPLLVTGVDALGRPFVERTSSLIINCHGCRYQSKHYVLKNMWVTMEVPHQESRQPPRTVRGRDRKSTRLNSSHLVISYAVFCLKKKKKHTRSHHVCAHHI